MNPTWEPICDCSGGMIAVSHHNPGPISCYWCGAPFVLALPEPDPGLEAGRKHMERISEECRKPWIAP